MRCHFLKLKIMTAKTNILMHNFCIRIAPVWNDLPQTISNYPLVNASNIKNFKDRLEHVNLDKYLQYDRNL